MGEALAQLDPFAIRLGGDLLRVDRRAERKIDGARTMIARAAAIGPGALEQVVTSLARAHYAHAELCRERDDVATRAALAGMHAAAHAGIGQLDR